MPDSPTPHKLLKWGQGRQSRCPDPFRVRSPKRIPFPDCCSLWDCHLSPRPLLFSPCLSLSVSISRRVSLFFSLPLAVSRFLPAYLFPPQSVLHARPLGLCPSSCPCSPAPTFAPVPFAPQCLTLKTGQMPPTPLPTRPFTAARRPSSGASLPGASGRGLFGGRLGSAAGARPGSACGPPDGPAPVSPPPQGTRPDGPRPLQAL